MVDTCAAEFEASTPYYYSVFGSENEAEETQRPNKKVLVLGSGPIRIGQGIEFDLLLRTLYLGIRKRRLGDRHRQQQPGDRIDRL